MAIIAFVAVVVVVVGTVVLAGECVGVGGQVGVVLVEIVLTVLVGLEVLFGTWVDSHGCAKEDGDMEAFKRRRATELGFYRARALCGSGRGCGFFAAGFFHFYARV